MMEFFYNITLTRSQNEIIANICNQTITPAEMSKIMFENFGQSEATIKFLQDKFDEKNYR